MTELQKSQKEYIVYLNYNGKKHAPPGAKRGYVYRCSKKREGGDGRKWTEAGHRGNHCIFSDCYLCYTKKCTEYTTLEKRVKVDQEGLHALKRDPRIEIKKIIEEGEKK